MTMSDSVAVLKTSPVRLGGQVDEEQAYFHWLFWTFLPCIEAFRHCKPLVSVDGTHLYCKYYDTLLVAIAQDGNSNIIPVAFALVKGDKTLFYDSSCAQLSIFINYSPTYSYELHGFTTPSLLCDICENMFPMP